MRTIRTANSTYEIDEDAKTIARMFGINKPTPAFGGDGIEHEYASVTGTAGGPLVIEWPEGAKEHTHTITSRVLADIRG